MVSRKAASGSGRCRRWLRRAHGARRHRAWAICRGDRAPAGAIPAHRRRGTPRRGRRCRRRRTRRQQCRDRGQRRGSGRSPSSGRQPRRSPPSIASLRARAARGRKREDAAARAQCRRHPRRGMAHQQQQRALRRLLQNFEQRIGAEPVELVDGIDDGDAPAALARRRAEKRHAAAHVVDRDVLAQARPFRSGVRSRMRRSGWACAAIRRATGCSGSMASDVALATAGAAGSGCASTKRARR